MRYAVTLFLVAVIAAAIGATSALLVVGPLPFQHSASAVKAERVHDELPPSATGRLSGHGFEEAAAKAATKVFEYEASARCPDEVLARKGYRFRCGALVEGQVYPVVMEVTSPLGFVIVRNVDGVVPES